MKLSGNLWLVIILKIHKKPRFSLSLKFLEKKIGVGQIEAPSAF